MAPRAASWPDLSAHDRAVRLPFPGVARELSDLLDNKLLAYIAGVRETTTIRERADGLR
jgi:hypothetical protein